ncbi:MAG: protein kinase [Planctomycetaceae bacterium]|nr:protein kinase [Planctomycetaceae bacterium]
MLDESAERDLLLAAKAVDQEIITPADLARAIAEWNQNLKVPLLKCLESCSSLNDERRRQLQNLFDSFDDSLDVEIAESIEDSVFGKLNDVLADAGNEPVKASIAKWSGLATGGRVLQLVSENHRFEIIAEHARGGLGEVLLARDRQLNRKVALKRIREKWADNEHARSRFQLEAEITGRLEHPGVVPVYALGQRPDGEIYYAMRLIRGKSLEAAADEFHSAMKGHKQHFQSPEFRDLLGRFIDVCNTISYAHSRGIIHRDLKPANIMLGKYGETLVVDWGLAKQVGVQEDIPDDIKESRILSDSGSGSAPTQFGSAVGTPQYMSPEQAMGRLDRMGPLTDVFGLGATLYYLLTGTPPQPGDSLENILERIEHGEFPKPVEVHPAVPLPLQAICLKALSVRPSGRYPTPTELGRDIDHWLADEPIAVYKDPMLVRATRWGRKNQTLAASTAVATLLLIAGAFTWNEVQHNRQQREAEIEKAEEVRTARLRDSLGSTAKLVDQLLENGRFSTAVSVLNGEIETLNDEADFSAECEQLRLQSSRLESINTALSLALEAQKANFLAMDEDEIIATVNSLELLGVWDHADWWNHLPAQDLDAAQHDHLKQVVYRNLVLLASTYTKLTGMRTLAASGGKMPPTIEGKFRAIFSRDGKDEARATIKICDLASRFQFAECLKWYRGIAAFRIIKGRMVPVSRLKKPRNAADAYELGIMTVTRAVRPDFPFTRYRGVKDDLMSARETMAIASEMSPDHYFTHIVMAQSEYLTAEAAVQANDPEAWRYYESSKQSFGRCISLQPDLPFAYADLSTVCLREYEVIDRSQTLSNEDVDRIQHDLLESCIQYALNAVRLGPNEGWVYWHYGHALAATGRLTEAMRTYAKALEMSYRFSEDSNSTLVDMDNIRGLDRIISETTKRVQNGDRRSLLNAVLAGAYLKQSNYETARPYARAACEVDDVDPFAWVIRGQLALHDGDFQLALNCFDRCSAGDPNSSWAAIGSGLACEALGRLEDARNAFRRARNLVITKYHAAAVELGMCRVQMRKGENEEAAKSLLLARKLYPACLLAEAEMIADELNVLPVKEAIESSHYISVEDIVQNDAILKSEDVPVLNGDFELPLNRYWHNPGAPAWHVVGEGESNAAIDPQSTHHGTGALHIRTSRMVNGARAMTRQTITVQESSAYEVTLWARSVQTARDAVFLCVVDEDDDPVVPLISIPAGQYDWKKISGTFTVPKSRRREPLSPMNLFLISSGVANVLIDDIAITRTGDFAESEADTP